MEGSIKSDPAILVNQSKNSKDSLINKSKVDMDQTIFMHRLTTKSYHNLTTLNVSDLVSEAVSEAKSEVP